MVIFNEVHGKLACILDSLAVDKVLPEGLLHQHIATVFFILQDASDAGDGPLRRIFGALDTLLFQFLFDHPQAGSGEIAFIDPSDDLRLFRNDLWLTILTFAVAIQLFILDADLSGFHGTAFTPCDIGGDGFTLGLGEGPGEGDPQFTVLLQRINVFLLEDDCDAELFERPDIVEAVHRVAGEAGNRLGQDHIDFLLAAVPDHPHEVLALLGRGSGDALVRKDEIEPGKPVYVICQSGLRSYIATRILEGYGYEAYNFAGGFRFYDAVVNDRALVESSFACGMDK